MFKAKWVGWDVLRKNNAVATICLSFSRYWVSFITRWTKFTDLSWKVSEFSFDLWPLYESNTSDSDFTFWLLSQTFSLLCCHADFASSRLEYLCSLVKINCSYFTKQESRRSQRQDGSGPKPPVIEESSVLIQQARGYELLKHYLCFQHFCPFLNIWAGRGSNSCWNDDLSSHSLIWIIQPKRWCQSKSNLICMYIFLLFLGSGFYCIPSYSINSFIHFVLCL